ncbi:hypothetical protein [Rubripirellula obstinata]|uniref:hypothetical protein n=1 Tax=Rubripirellula obstinata TaxID=406547 RepID=UPI00122CF96A|nr:hypothetical protein [Rubripirellula obstinata]
MLIQNNQDDNFYSTFTRRRYDNRHHAEASEAKAMAEAEAMAGRPLTENDFRKGSLADRVDTRSGRERIRDETRKVVSLVPGSSDEPTNIYEKLLAYRRANKPESYEQMLQRKADETATTTELQKRVEAFHADPERVELVEKSAGLVEAARWNPEADETEWQAVNFIHETAKVGDLELTRGMIEDHEYAVAERDQIKRLQIEEQIRGLQSQLDS